MPEEDKLKKIADAVKALAKKQVLVGIPMETSSRSQSEWLNMLVGGKSGAMSNASLGYIHEFGSPAVNIPARPHLVPGVTKALDDIKARLTAAAKAAVNGNLQVAEQYLGQAGQSAVNSVQGVIRSGELKPLAESTVTARRLRRPDLHYRTRIRIVEEEEARRAKVADLRRRHQPIPPDLQHGVHLREAQTAAQATPLIDTGSYIRALTWVIRER